MNWVRVANEADVLEGRPLQVAVEGRAIALCRWSGTLYALDDACPHQGASLSNGPLEDGVLVCPRHRWQFDVKTGCAVVNPSAFIDAYDVKVEDGAVFVSTAPRPRP